MYNAIRLRHFCLSVCLSVCTWLTSVVRRRTQLFVNCAKATYYVSHRSLFIRQNYSLLTSNDVLKLNSKWTTLMSNITKSSASADKPARHVYRSFKVTKHGTIRYSRYGFLLVCYSNFVPNKGYFTYFTSKMP